MFETLGPLDSIAPITPSRIIVEIWIARKGEASAPNIATAPYVMFAMDIKERSSIGLWWEGVIDLAACRFYLTARSSC